MLTLVPDGRDRYAEAGLLATLGNLTAAAELLLQMTALILVAAVLISGGQAWAWSLIGAAGALTLSRHGPPWWPGRR